MSRSSRTVLGLVILAFLAAGLVAITPAWAASVESSATTVVPGQSLALFGFEFEPDVSVKLCWDGQNCANLGRATPGEDGSFVATVSVPATAGGGLHSISACQAFNEGTSDERLLCGSVSLTVSAVDTTTTTLATTTTTPATTTSTSATTTSTAATTTTSTTLAPTTTTTTPPTTDPTVPSTLATTTTIAPTPTTPTTTTTTTPDITSPTTTTPSVIRSTTLPSPTTTVVASVTGSSVLDASDQDANSDPSQATAALQGSTTSTAPAPSGDGEPDTREADASTSEAETEVLGLSIEADPVSTSDTVDTVNWPLTISLLTAAVVLLILAIRLIVKDIRSPSWLR